jgi:hypothetical protein
MNLIKFQSDPALTEFAPQWNFLMAEDTSFSDVEFFKSISNIILEKESSLISSNENKYQEYNKKFNIVYDGDTGLGPNSLTSRAIFFNFLSWEDIQVRVLHKFIHLKYVEFLDILKIPRRKTWIQCWANVMRDGEEIKNHIHSSHPLTWLGGHVTIACSNTSTFYVNPMNLAHGNQVYESKNEVGKLTLFQNNIPHYTNTHHGSTERISIAFDIIVDERLSQYSEERKTNFILFDNP